MACEADQALTCGPTIAQALASATQRLRSHGVDQAGGDARRLMQAATGASTAALIVDGGRVLSREEFARFEAMVQRRTQREPVARILGTREFYGRPFIVTPDVLDPRPATETLIETALEICRREGFQDQPIHIVDVGTGSGAILLTLLAELPLARGTGIDISPGALACAARNAAGLGLASRADWMCRDLALGLPGDATLIVSNPPYIPTGAVAGLDPEVRNYDPRIALDGGVDGLNLYRALCRGVLAAAGQAPGPQWLIVEAGAGQSHDIVEILRINFYPIDPGDVIVRLDLAGHARCVAAKTR